MVKGVTIPYDATSLNQLLDTQLNLQVDTPLEYDRWVQNPINHTDVEVIMCLSSSHFFLHSVNH